MSYRSLKFHNIDFFVYIKYGAHLGKFSGQMKFPSYTYKKWTLRQNVQRHRSNVLELLIFIEIVVVFPTRTVQYISKISNNGKKQKLLSIMDFQDRCCRTVMLTQENLWVFNCNVHFRFHNVYFHSFLLYNLVKHNNR